MNTASIAFSASAGVAFYVSIFVFIYVKYHDFNRHRFGQDVVPNGMTQSYKDVYEGRKAMSSGASK
jgi:hypothetical protein